MSHTTTTAIPLISTTKSEQHAYFLTDRFGEWNAKLPEEFKSLPDRFPFDAKKDSQLCEGDPRRLQTSEDCFVALRNNQVGILIEHELDAVLNDEPEAIAAHSPTKEYSSKEYNAIVSGYQEKLTGLQQKWHPEAEVFLADGYSIFDSRLAACAFIPLKGTMDTGYSSPFAENDTRQITGLINDMEAVVFGLHTGLSANASTVDQDISAKPIIISNAELNGVIVPPGQTVGAATANIRLTDLMALLRIAKAHVAEIQSGLVYGHHQPADNPDLNAIVEAVSHVEAVIATGVHHKPAQRAVVVVYGGNIQNIIADGNIEILRVDRDTEDNDQDGVMMLDGQEAIAVIESAAVDAGLVNDYFTAVSSEHKLSANNDSMAPSL